MQRQIQREGGAAARLARRVDLAAEQPRDLPADRQAEAGAAVLAARGAVGLLERLEDHPHLAGGDADAGVGHGERDQVGVGVPQRTGLQELLPDGVGHVVAGEPDDQFDRSGVGELHRVGQQVAQHLQEALFVRVQRRGQLRRHAYGEVESLLCGQRAESGLYVVHELDERDARRADVHLARLDLRQVEDVVDELEQVRARAVDRLGELHLLGREVRVGVVGEQLGQDQQGVERRTQLVRHVREELGLVAHRDRELFGALLEDLAGLFDLGVLDLDVAVLLGEQRGLVLQFGVGLLQRLLPVLQLLGALAQLLGQFLRLLEQDLRLGVDADGVDASLDHLGDLAEEVLLDLRERLEGRQLDDPEHLAFEEHRQHDDLRRGRLAEPGGDPQIAGRGVLHEDGAPLLGGRSDQRLTGPERRRHGTHRIAVAAQHAQLVRVLVTGQVLRVVGGHGQEERAVLCRDDRRQLTHDQRGDVLQVAAALHQAGDPRQVALEPVLFLVGEGGVAEVRDHRVDVVLEDLDLARRVHVDLQVQVAARHRGGDGRDRAHLPGEVPGHLVHGLRQVAPGAVDVPHPRLAAQLALGAHLAGDPGDLLGERRQLVDHRVDGGLELKDLAARVDVDLLGEVALGDGRGDHRDVAHLTGQVGRHPVHGLGEVLPRTGHSRDAGLASEDAVRTHLTGHLRDLVGERTQRLHHGVEGVRELRDLAARLDRHRLREVAVGDGRGDLRDVPHLHGQVVGHQVDVVAEVLPDARDADHPRLTAQLALRAHLTGHPRDLLRERRQLVDHGVHRRDELENLALRVDGDLLGQVAHGHGRGDLGDVAHLEGEVVRHAVHGLRQVLPRTRHALHLGLSAEDAVRTHLAGHPRHLLGEGRELVHHRVEGVLQLQDLAPGVHVDLLRQVTARHRGRDLRDVAHLRGEVAGHAVHGVREVAPHTGHAGHLRLPAQPALRAHLARHARHLVGERGKLVDHRVDGVLQLQDLAARVHVDLLRQVTARHRRRHLGDLTHLRSQVPRHEVDGVRELLPRTADTVHARLAAEAPLRAHVPRHPRDLVGERRQLVHHGVHGVLQLKHLSGDVDRDLLGEVAVRHRRRHLRDVAHLTGEVAEGGVHRVGEVLPRARGARHLRLPAELALDADLPRHPRHFGTEGGKLVHHRVDGVLQLQHLARDIDGDLLRQVAVRHRRGHLRDVAHLSRQVPEDRVDGVGQILPSARGTRHIGLPAELPLGTDLVGDARHLVRERTQRLRHLVDGLGELGHLAARAHPHLLRQIAVRDGRRDLGDAPHLRGQVARHQVDRIGEVLPHTRDARHLRLPAELALRADLPGDPGHLGGERGELVHHRVDGVLQLQHLAGHMHGDLARQITLRDRGRHQGDVPHLRRQPVRHRVDRIREVLPRTGHTSQPGLPAQLALRAHLAGHPRDLVGERRELVHEVVDRAPHLQELATQRMAVALVHLRAQLHTLLQVALRDRGKDTADLGDGPYEILHQRVGGVDRRRPGALHGPALQALCELSLTPDGAPHPRQLTGEMEVTVGDLIEDGSDLRHHIVAGHRETLAEIAVPHRHQSGKQPVQGRGVHRGRRPVARLALTVQGPSVFRARLSGPRRSARLHCVPPARVDRTAGGSFWSPSSVSPWPNQAITVRQLRTPSAHPPGGKTGDRHQHGRRR
ncbi:putative Hybrid signal transduction histidine kinase J [Streptomyces aurantiacus JA 4570]|uniref:Putative Hybrid signal transduction histidine kinase J n=1 Tax=Streptomyces aurantiacus JA 4570 TaxID=1286094 RepID=S3ZUF8_9ACTN|nr:putative Hybrid signal transduction histidine kinase J [Streptomyces aurantiacus JA 4570]